MSVFSKLQAIVLRKARPSRPQSHPDLKYLPHAMAIYGPTICKYYNMIPGHLNTDEEVIEHFTHVRQEHVLALDTTSETFRPGHYVLLDKDNE